MYQGAVRLSAVARYSKQAISSDGNIEKVSFECFVVLVYSVRINTLIDVD